MAVSIKKILDFTDLGKPTGLPILDRSIKIASAIQNLRIHWGKGGDCITAPDGNVIQISDVEEIQAVMDGRIFPSEYWMDVLVSLYDESDAHPIPKTPEVLEYYRYLTEGGSIYSNQMVDKIHRIKSPSDEKRMRCAQLKERQRICNILVKEGIIDKSSFRRLVG